MVHCWGRGMMDKQIEERMSLAEMRMYRWMSGVTRYVIYVRRIGQTLIMDEGE